MENYDLIKLIDKYDLSIRRIPDEIVSLYDTRHATDDDEIVEHNGRKFVKKVRIPEHPGWYMVKSVSNTDSLVRWNMKTDNLSDSLEGSINLFLSKVKTKS
jgi:hypothetical protein